jgi:hypothetical protein
MWSLDHWKSCGGLFRPDPGAGVCGRAVVAGERDARLAAAHAAAGGDGPTSLRQTSTGSTASASTG